MKTLSPFPTWEAHLIERASAGEQVAFELIVDQYRPGLLAFAQRMLRNGDDANDAVQEAFVKAFKGLKDFDSRRPLKPWLTRICANCCVDIIRERKRKTESLEPYEFMLESTDTSLDEEAERSLARERIGEALKKLPRKYRDIVMMRHFRDMEVNEIAVELGTPEGTVKSWLFRARAMLRNDLSPSDLGIALS